MQSTPQVRSRTLLSALLGLAYTESLATQDLTPVAPSPPTALVRAIPADGQVGVALDRRIALVFSRALHKAAGTRAVSMMTGDQPLSTRIELSHDGTTLYLLPQPAWPALSHLVVTVDGDQMRDCAGNAVDADGDGVAGGQRTLSFRSDPGVQRVRSPVAATVTGFVFDTSEPPRPIVGAIARGYAFPRREGEAPLAVPPAITDSNGFFRWQTPPVFGDTAFLIEITKPGFSECLREVHLSGNDCWRVTDARLQSLTPPVLVTRATGATLNDPLNPQVVLVIPPGALQQDSNVGVTLLQGSEFLRDRLPELVAEGSFVDVKGVFGEETEVPVTLRVPNIYNLPVGTSVPFGKVDHNTLMWSDLRDLSPTGGLGVVRQGTTSTYIEVSFDKFCSICTSYCLPFPRPQAQNGSGGPKKGLPDCDGPGTAKGNSLITLREGYLQETITLAALHEMQGTFGIALGYASHTAMPSVTLSARTDYASTRPVEATEAEFQVEGLVVRALFDRSTDNQKPVATFFWDGRDGLGQQKPTGAYPWTFVATSYNLGARVAVPPRFGQAAAQIFSGTYPGISKLRSAPVSDLVVLVNQRGSPFGAGWSLLQEARLHFDTDGCIVMTFGNGDFRLYEPAAAQSNRWRAPAGDSAVLVYDPASATYQRQLGGTATQVFDYGGRMVRLTDRHAQSVTFAYNQDRIARVTSATGHFYDFTYDGAGKLSSIVDSAARATNFVVDASGDLVQATDPAGVVRTFQYDSQHRLVAQRGPRNDRRQYVYRNGRVIAARAYDIDGTTLLRERTFTPSALQGEMSDELRQGRGVPGNPIALAQGRIDRLTDGLGNESTRETNDGGQTIMATDALGRVTRFAFDANRNLTSRTRPDNTLTEYTYDSAGRLLTLREKSNATTVYSTRTLEHNGPLGQLSRVIDEEGKRTDYGYDANGNLSTVTDHDGRAVDTTYGDARFPQLPTRLTYPTGDFVTVTWDSHGNLLTFTDYPDPVANPAGRTVTFAYDAAGNVVTVTDARNAQRRYQYDGLGRVLATTDALMRTTTLSYVDPTCNCPTHRVHRVTFADNSTHTYTYDGLDRLLVWTDQLGKTTTYSHDAEDRVIAMTNRNLEAATFAYDAIGRLVQRALPGGETIDYQWDLRDRMTAASDPLCRVQLAYDLLGRPTQVIEQVDLSIGSGPPLTLLHRLDYVVDRVGNRRSVIDNWGTAQTLTFDNLHRLATLTLPSRGNLAWTFTYDAAGRRAQLTPSSGARTTYTFDRASQLTALSFMSMPALDVVHSALDTVGNILTRVRALGALALTSTYVYDALGQLARGRFSQNFGDARVDRTATYDVAGRLLADGDYTYSYDDEGRLVRRVKNGSTLTDHYTWDFDGKLRRYEQTIDSGGGPTPVLDVTYGYDPLHRRIEKRVNGVARRYLYDGADVLCELDGQNRIERAFTHGPGTDEPLAVHDNVANATLFFHRDHQGSIVGITDTAGNVVQTYDYDDYGGVVARTAATTQHLFGYTGRDSDLESGFVNLRARLYDPSVGRFLTQDPLGLRAGLNAYRYVHNNPINARDPFGLQDEAGPWTVGWEWLTGGGPRDRYFTNGHYFTNLLQQHEHIQNVRNTVTKNIRDGGALEGNKGYYLGGTAGVPKYLKDYSTLATAGQTGNLAVTYLGSYTLQYRVLKVDMHKALVQFQVWNNSTIESATHPPVVGYTPWWSDNIGKPLNDFFATGPMSKTSQHFNWAEWIEY